MAQIEQGSPEFRRTSLALFSAGFATFALLYFVQPLLPVFTEVFHLSPARSSLALSSTTGMLSVSMLLAGAVSEGLGRKPIMVVSLFASALLDLASVFSPSWNTLLIMRALAGITLSGLPAVAMAYLGEEIDRRSIGLAMGLYIGGSGLGGMAGRLLTGLIVDFFSWRIAIAVIGLIGLGAAFVFWRNLPESTNFRPRSLAPRHVLGAFRAHFRDPALRWLFLEGFLLMGSFVTVYNYIGFRLLAPPFGISQSVLGTIFTVYLVGIAGSAWIGQIAGRVGRRKLMWPMITVILAGALVTLSSSLPAIIAGVVLVTFGFFGAHSVGSSWVAQRAQHAKAQASSLYLFAYYLGSSIIGAGGGLFWSRWGWSGVVSLLAVLLALALGIAVRLRAILPLTRIGITMGP
jgi:YNFM family putative membrane transporter